jgi:hypothetical protein
MCLPPHVRTETNPVSETCFLLSRIPDNGQSDKNAAILSVFSLLLDVEILSYDNGFHSHLNWAEL